MIEFVTIEHEGGIWRALLWAADLTLVARGVGKSAQAALQNAMGCLPRSPGTV